MKNRRGKSKSGRKVTGLAFQPAAGGGGRKLDRNSSGGGLLLVTSGDARLRLFDGYGLACKAKGPTLGCDRSSSSADMSARLRPL